MIEDCTGCRNCIACFGLKNQEYCYGNQRIGKEAFEKISAEYKNLSHAKIADLKSKFDILKSNLPHVQWHLYNSEGSSGDNILNSKGCENAFQVLVLAAQQKEGGFCFLFWPQRL